MLALLTEIGVVAADPVFAAGGEEVGDDGVFEDVDGVRNIGGDLEGFARAEGDVFAFDVEDNAAGVDDGDLFVDVVVVGDVAALLEFEAGDGHAGGVHDAAMEVRGDLFEGDLIPVVNNHRL